MNKSLYSLILSDDVVREIDRLAYRSGANRSSMINQILAEYVSYTTPEMRFNQIFSALESMLLPADNFKRLINNSISVMNLRSSLDYKYNPSVKYSLELYKGGDAIGALKMSMRTQNAALISYMMDFYKLFAGLESSYIKGTSYYLEGDKFVRELKDRTGRQMTAEELGNAIAEYIKTVDKCLKAYFYNIDNEKAATFEVDRILAAYIDKNGAIL